MRHYQVIRHSREACPRGNGERESRTYPSKAPERDGAGSSNLEPVGVGAVREPPLLTLKMAIAEALRERHALVGHRGLEPRTSVLSGLRSNRLS